MNERTFKTQDAAMRALALAEGYKGSAGGWIYRPRIEHLPIKPGHSAQHGSVPAEWLGTHVTQSWKSFFARSRYAARIGETAEGRFYVLRADELAETLKIKTNSAYAEYLASLAEGSPTALLKAKVDGWKVRLFAAYELAYGGTVKIPKAARVHS